MSDLPKELRDSVLHDYLTSLRHATVTSTKHVQEDWQRGEQLVTERLEAAKRDSEAAEALLRSARREHEAAEAEVRLREDTASKVFDFLVSTFSAIPLETIRQEWDAQGDLVPPGIRGLLGELRSEAQPLPSPALSTAGSGFPQQPTRPPPSDVTRRQSDGISVRSESLTKDPSSSKRPADSPPTSLDQTGNKRARVSNSDYTFPLSEDGSSPAPRNYRGTVQACEIEGLHWAFKSPVTGPGYYVLLCNERDKGDKDAFRFQYDPWDRNRARNHYTKMHDCHEGYFDLQKTVVGEGTIMQRFGYLVEDMTDDDCCSSNQRIEDERTVAKKKPKTTFRKGPQIQTIHRTLPHEGPAPVPDMGLYANGYVQPSVEDDITAQVSWFHSMATESELDAELNAILDKALETEQDSQ